MHKPTPEDRVDWIKKSADRLEKMLALQNLPRKSLLKEAAVLLKRTFELFLALHGEEIEEDDHAGLP